jgi:hypothetical protein
MEGRKMAIRVLGIRNRVKNIRALIISGAPADAAHRRSGRVQRPALAATVSAGLVVFMLSPVLAGSASASTRATPVPSAERAGLTAAYAAYKHIPVKDLAGIQPGSVRAATVGGLEWATASFNLVRTASPAIQDSFQDGGSIGVFTRRGHAAWKMRGVGGEPFPCGSVVPAAVRLAWGLAAPAACRSTVAATPTVTPRAETETGTTASIASIALSQVGVADNPPETNFDGLDCNPYTTLVGNPDGAADCGTTTSNGSWFSDVENASEFWCADFAKWVWEQAGITADLSVLNPGATSFGLWAFDQGESTAFDSGTPAVGDAIVFYPPGTSAAVYQDSSGNWVGSPADHVGVIVGVDPSNGTVDLVNGDFLGPTNNIGVWESGYVNIQNFANSTWASGEEWVLVSPNLPAAPPLEVAFQANQTGDLYTYNPATDGSQNIGLGMAAGTSPAIADLPGGGFEVAFEAKKTDDLYIYDSQSNTSWNTNLGMAAGTSPAIAASPAGGEEVAFQANGTGDLYMYDPQTGGSYNAGLGMAAGTSPAIAASPDGGYEVAFQANGTGDLYMYDPQTGGSYNAGLGMAAGTSPSIAADLAGDYEVAFQANGTGDLYLYDPQTGGSYNAGLGMAAGTSPAIAASPDGGFEVAFQANSTSDLYMYDPQTNGSYNAGLGMAVSTSPAMS